MASLKRVSTNYHYSAWLNMIGRCELTAPLIRVAMEMPK